jgi:hypothetical protein
VVREDDRAIYEYGEIAHAPLTDQALRRVDADELGTVLEVYYQAEQVHLRAEDRYAGPYQILKVEMDRGDGPKVGLYWSVYDGVEFAALHETTSARREGPTLRHGLDEVTGWLRKCAGRSPRWTFVASRLEELVDSPSSVRFDGVLDDLAAVVFLYLWLKRYPVGFLTFVVDVIDYDKYVDNERYVRGRAEGRSVAEISEFWLRRRIRVGSARLAVPRDVRQLPLDRMAIEALKLVLRPMSKVDIARLATEVMGGHAVAHYVLHEDELPLGVSGEELVLFGPFTIDGELYPVVHARSAVVLRDGAVVTFTFWPNRAGHEQAVEMPKAQFFSELTGRVVWFPGPLPPPAHS